MSETEKNNDNSQQAHNHAMRDFERDKVALGAEFSKDFKVLVELDKRKASALERIAQQKPGTNGLLLGVFIAAAGAIVGYSVDGLRDAVEKQTAVIANNNSCSKAPAPVLNK